MAPPSSAPTNTGWLTALLSFLQMSGMTLGSMIEADHRLRAHELIIRNHKKLARDLEVWKRYEAEIERSAEEAASTKTRDAEK